MKLFHRLENNTCLISVVGNLALSETAELEAFVEPLIRDDAINKLVINCKSVEIIDSRGVGLLAAILKDLEDLGKSLVLCHLNPAALQILQSLQLDKLITIAQSEEEALSLATG